MIKKFKHSKPRKYLKRMLKSKIFQKPTGITKNSIIWQNLPRPYVLVKIIDESVKHNFPKKHYDFVYTTAKFDEIPIKKAQQLIAVSGSIIIDRLKKEVTTRCGGLSANDYTLGFVKAVIDGKIKPTKENYAKVINKSINYYPNMYKLHKYVK